MKLDTWTFISNVLLWLATYVVCCNSASFALMKLWVPQVEAWVEFKQRGLPQVGNSK